MYYYIFQSPKNYSENKTHEQIKNILTIMGISGENTNVSPARTATELALMGIGKGYSTIVAIGGDELINEVASNIVGSGAALGIIPINASTDIYNLINTNNIKEACDALQKRYLEDINMGYLEPGINFLTNIHITSSKALNIQAEINNFYFETRANKVVIDNNLCVKIFAEEEKINLISNLFGMFKNKNNNLSNLNSIFYANKIRLRTHEIIPIKIANLTIAKTPIVLYQKNNALKIIKFYSKI